MYRTHVDASCVGGQSAAHPERLNVRVRQLAGRPGRRHVALSRGASKTAPLALEPGTESLVATAESCAGYAASAESCRRALPALSWTAASRFASDAAAIGADEICSSNCARCDSISIYADVAHDR